ncbi:AMIN-like domain-containing (lipo)protein [Zafaria sp. J156]|uniref:AMIN-like domain-containing (lipo)protein n=1 Tax=Zafaria sp. J156 TaxID=3116490 RepID=UPI003D367DBE
MKTLRAGIASALLVAGLGLAPIAPAAAAPYCGITWGSLAETRAAMSTAQLTGVRAGRHGCFDRLVFDLRGKARGYDVRYVTAVYTEGEGRRVPLTGAADLQIVVRAPAYTPAGRPTYLPANRNQAVPVPGYSTFRQVAFLGSFEGQTSFGLGVRARLPFRAFVLDGPGTGSRLFLDVAHRL